MVSPLLTQAHEARMRRARRCARRARACAAGASGCQTPPYPTPDLSGLSPHLAASGGLWRHRCMPEKSPSPHEGHVGLQARQLGLPLARTPARVTYARVFETTHIGLCWRSGLLRKVSETKKRPPDGEGFASCGWQALAREFGAPCTGAFQPQSVSGMSHQMLA